jgi:predicted ArsR family transcriptional regulator
METRTRRLIALLADDLTAELIALLRDGQTPETNLRKNLSASRQSVSRRLEDLETWGIVVGRRHVTPGRGAPTTMWRLTGSRISAFEDSADRLTLELLEDAAAEQRAALEGGPEPTLRLVERRSGLRGLR